MNGNFDISNQICEAKYDKTFTTNHLISLFSYIYILPYSAFYRTNLTF